MRTDVSGNAHQPKGASRTGHDIISPVTHGHRIRQLDAVRGIAILVVILHNEAGKHLPAAWTPIFANGWMGVDLFFVLSGFLITGILLDTKGSQHFIRDFYIRRCLRIWPLYYSLLLFMFVLVPLVRPEEAIEIFGERSQPWWSYPLFLQNFFVPIPQNAAGPLGVTWSLGIEELFYLLWPWAFARVRIVRCCGRSSSWWRCRRPSESCSSGME